MNTLKFALPIVLGATVSSVSAHATEGTPHEVETKEKSVQIVAETQDFSDELGSQRTITLDYKLKTNGLTLVVSPAVGERRASGTAVTALGGGAALYVDVVEGVASHSQAFFSENEPVFAKVDLVQDFTVRVAQKTNLTAGARWARYFGDRDVTFAFAGIRQYFKGGSASYRLTYIDPEDGSSFLSHLVNVNLNDRRGTGKTQIWLATGATSLTRSQLDQNFSGDDHSAVIRRTQPVANRFSLIGTVGFASYARPEGRVSAPSIGIGVLIGLD